MRKLTNISLAWDDITGELPPNTLMALYSVGDEKMQNLRNAIGRAPVFDYNPLTDDSDTEDDVSREDLM